MSRLIIEVLDHFGKVKTRYIKKEFPITIGRDYSNEIIINDAYTSPKHASIQSNENGFNITDVGSENGLFNTHPFKKLKQIEIKDDTRIRIGHTDIRFRLSDHPIKETLLDIDKPSQVNMFMNSDLALPIILIIFSLAFMLNDYIETTTETDLQILLNNIFPLLIFMILWAMAWSTLSKIFTRRLFFYFHASWVICLTMMSIIANNIGSYIEFSFSLSSFSLIFSFITGVIITAILFYGHLHYSTNLSRLKAKRIAIISSFLILSLIELSSLLNNPSFSNLPNYSSIIRPNTFILSKQHTLNSFFEETSYLKESVDEMIKN